MKAAAVQTYLGDGSCHEVRTMQTPLFPWRPVVIPGIHCTCKHLSETLFIFFFMAWANTLCGWSPKLAWGGQRWAHLQCEHDAGLKQHYSCLLAAWLAAWANCATYSLGHAIRSQWRTELILGTAICRPGVMHMAYLGSSVPAVY